MQRLYALEAFHLAALKAFSHCATMMAGSTGKHRLCAEMHLNDLAATMKLPSSVTMLLSDTM